ncbi:hypothetical protein EKO04_010089 [Ascochyta lentis]|uniref:Uncharacterized protein n=1 Tax=Ascochyta lentis TaxID=205686 RepID=A0A8H7IZ99_9PLEO|nr:hypothetical protein EKO04_010089 [Ascochyta lentis]
MASHQTVQLPKFYLNADGMLRGRIPDLNIGHEGIQTVRPDIVAKLQINGEEQVRMVEELNFYTTVDLGDMVIAAMGGSTTRLCAILGQVMWYMIEYKTRYAFISNYNETVFLLYNSANLIGEQKPCLYFSKVIHHSHTVHEASSTISVRLGIFYLIHKTYSSNANDWRINDAEADYLDSIAVENLAKSNSPAQQRPAGRG